VFDLARYYKQKVAELTGRQAELIEQLRVISEAHRIQSNRAVDADATLRNLTCPEIYPYVKIRAEAEEAISLLTGRDHDRVASCLQDVELRLAKARAKFSLVQGRP